MDPEAARLFADRYRIVRTLGAGSMGTVYQAQDTAEGGRLVALKTLERSPVDPWTARCLEHEFHVMRRLRHPHLCPSLDWGQEAPDGVPYLVMEFVDGPDLVTATAGASPATVAALGAQVAAGVGWLHAHGLVHCDLKPANVLVARLAGSPVAKVVDFGLAGGRPGETGISTAELFGTRRRGSPAYMSPEVIQGRSMDHRSDLYSLGVTLYEALLGRPPFPGPDKVTVAYAHVNTPPAPPRLVRPEIPAELEGLVLGLLAKRPEDRPRDANEVVDLLVDRCGAPRPAGERGPPSSPVFQAARGAAEVHALIMEGRGLGMEGATDRALLVLGEALRSARAPGHPPALLRFALVQLAVALYHGGALADARAALEEARGIAARDGADLALEVNQSLVLSAEGRLGEALVAAEAAARLDPTLGGLVEVSLLLEVGAVPPARRRLRSLPMDPAGAAPRTLIETRCLALEGRWPEVEAALGAARATGGAATDAGRGTRDLAGVALECAVLAMEAGRWDLAGAWHAWAGPAAGPHALQDLLAITVGAALALYAQERPGETLGRALRRAERCGAPLALARVERLLGRLRSRTGAHAEASTRYLSALKKVREVWAGLPEELRAAFLAHPERAGLRAEIQDFQARYGPFG